MTKEELVKKVAVLEKENENFRKAEKDRLDEFAKVFQWTTRTVYSFEDELKNCQWSDVFCEIGRLLARKAQLDTEERINSIEHQLEATNRLLVKFRKEEDETR